MWEYDLAAALKRVDKNEFQRMFYKATYSSGKWTLFGGQLGFAGDKVKYCRAAGSSFSDGDSAWCILDPTSGTILIIDLVG